MENYKENMRKSLVALEELCRQLYDEYFTLSAIVDAQEGSTQVNKELE